MTKPQVTFFPDCKKHKTPTGAVTVDEPVTFTMSFTRPQNPSEVFLSLVKDGETPVNYPMTLVKDEDGEYTYTITVKITSAGLYFYHFEIHNEDMIYRVGSDDSLRAMLGKGGDWQLTVMDEAYAPTPLDGGIVYEIMPDRFNIGGERNKTKPYARYRDDWGGVPEYAPNKDGKLENVDFFGGNIKGITKKLTYLKNLGVTAIWLTPVFEAHSNHKYDAGNYMRIDPDFGTEADLKDLITKARKRGIAVILDGVFSHTGDDSIYFNKYGAYDTTGAYQSVKSPYYPWYKFDNWRDGYKSRYNIDIMPETNSDDPMFKEFVTGPEGVISKWTRLGLGGWRIEVCENLSDDFLVKARRAALRENPDAVMYGDMLVDASNPIIDGRRRSFITGGKLDAVANHPFRSDILNFVRCGDAKRLDNTIAFVINNYPKRAVDAALNILDDHDGARLITALGDNGDIVSRDDKATARVKNKPDAIKLVKLATALQYTLPGIPCVYYGDEAGLEGFEDPFDRGCYPWGNADKELLGWYKKLGRLRTAEREIFAHGRYCAIDTDHGVMFFKRKQGDKTVYVIVNNSGSEYAPELEGGEYTDLITYKPFSGVVADRSVAIVKLTNDTVFPVKKSRAKKA